MIAAPFPHDENERLKTLQEMHLLDTPLEERFERITRLVRQILKVPSAAFTLVDENRQWFKSIQGVDATETPREFSFCAHAILEEDILHVSDATKDVRFADNPYVTGGLSVRFYAGCPVKAPNGQAIGALCAIDSIPRDVSPPELQSLRDLAAMVETELRAAQLSGLQKELLAELNIAQTMALVDPLTRTWNRRGIYELIKRRWSECARSGEVMVVVMADIDHFKNINDKYGHPAGDKVLQTVSRKLLAALREEDAVGRVGGEEFLLLLTGCEVGELKRTVERIRLSVASSTLSVGDESDVEVTLSFGAAAGLPSMFSSYDDLIKFADEALYNAKKAGRNRVEVNGS